MPLNARRSIAAALSATMLGGLATLYRFPPTQYSFYPRCPIHAAFGILCPGCGSTRALAALVHGHLAEAWRWNQLFVALMPLALLFTGASLLRALRSEPFVWPRIPRAATYALALITTLFFIARNIR